MDPSPPGLSTNCCGVLRTSPSIRNRDMHRPSGQTTIGKFVLTEAFCTNAFAYRRQAAGRTRTFRGSLAVERYMLKPTRTVAGAVIGADLGRALSARHSKPATCVLSLHSSCSAPVFSGLASIGLSFAAMSIAKKPLVAAWPALGQLRAYHASA